MNEPTPKHRDAERLIAAYLDETLGDEERAALRELLQHNPQLMLDLAQMTQLEEHVRGLLAEQAAVDSVEPGNLLVAINALSAGEDDAELVDLTDRMKARRTEQRKASRPTPSAPTRAPGRVLVIPRSLAYAALVAVTASVLIGAFALSPSKSPPMPGADNGIIDLSAPRGSAQVVRTRDVKWAGIAPGKDGWMDAGLYRLEQGFVEMTFADGASVLIHGPSSFELISGSRMELKTGMASARVPDGAEGFTIESPAGEFVDLGTAFGVDISGAGLAELHVFEGAVEAHTRSSTLSAPLLVRGGEAVAVDSAKLSPERMNYRPEKFAKTWEATRNGVEVSESIRFLFDPPASVRSHQLEHSEQIFMFAEQRGVVLDRPLHVSFKDPGRYVRFLPNQLTLQAGTRVDSYFVHFDRVGTPGYNALVPIGGVITFDRPVVGIIAYDGLLDRSQRLFRLGGTSYPPKHDVRGLEYVPKNGADPSDLSRYQDLVVLSKDRRTVRLHLETSSNVDQLRILVQADALP